MALKKEITTASGVNLPDAYHRVGDLDIRRTVDSDGTAVGAASIHVHIYKDSSARTDGLPWVDQFYFKVTSDFTSYYGTEVLDGTNVNPVSQTYAYMKTQSDLHGIDYTDSTDV